VLYNGDTLPEDCARADVRIITQPFTALADAAGSAKAGNMIMLGALLEATGMFEEKRITGALRNKVKSQKWYDLDLAALAQGRKAAKEDIP
jgi:Pyruvate/2-oxoacid:ferredoxin oxidoreductase gamma subunit